VAHKNQYFLLSKQRIDSSGNIDRWGSFDRVYCLYFHVDVAASIDKHKSIRMSSFENELSSCARCDAFSSMVSSWVSICSCFALYCQIFKTNVSIRPHASALIRCLRYKTTQTTDWQALTSDVTIRQDFIWLFSLSSFVFYLDNWTAHWTSPITIIIGYCSVSSRSRISSRWSYSNKFVDVSSRNLLVV
jgi:hypothetical protein